MSLAGELEARRAALGWTYAEIAVRVGYSINTVRKVFRGDATVRQVTFCEVAAALGYQVALVAIAAPGAAGAAGEAQ